MRQRLLLLSLFATVALAATTLPACSEDDPTYTYFLVRLEVDRSVSAENLHKVSSCVVAVEGADNHAHQKALENCSFGFSAAYDLGFADFSTNVTKGQVRFHLTLRDPNLVVIAEGISEYVDIVPGQTLSAAIVARPAPGQDGGVTTPEDSGADAAGDAAGDASVGD